MATSLKLNEAMKNRIQSIADVYHRSAHWIMLEAIRDYVEREEAKISFKQEALESWKNYQETGQHLRGDDVRSWLRTWGTDNENKIPPCHN